MRKVDLQTRKIGEFCSKTPRKKDTGLISNGSPDAKLVFEDRILYKDTLYISKIKNDNIVQFHLVDSDITYYNENSLLQIMRSTDEFIQINRSVIVNIHYISSANYNFSTLYLGEKRVKVRVSNSYRSKVKVELSKLYFL